MKRPGMYVADESDYRSVVAFLSGFDLASEHEIFLEFSEWLMKRYNFRSAQVWGWAVESLYNKLKDENDIAVRDKSPVDFLFANIEAFFDH